VEPKLLLMDLKELEAVLSSTKIKKLLETTGLLTLITKEDQMLQEIIGLQNKQ
jgi:hypothetical protein